jgi:glyoxylase-like metal-dependent hydrolase (beta-lactamase superfamily II)
VQFVRSALDRKGGGGTGLPIVNQMQNQFIQPNAAWPQQVDIWLTPYGFLTRARSAGASTSKRTVGGKTFDVVSFAVDKYKVNGYINEQGLVERVETWLDHPALGDMLLEASYSDYAAFEGLQFPKHIVQSQGGYPTLDVTVTSVKPNAPVVIQQPQRGGGAGGVNLQAPVRSVKAADGVFLIIGGPNNSIAVEFNDYMVMIEAPMNEERAQAFIAEARRAIPGKPIKYLINTHHHFDHSGALRAFAAEGVTIVTHESNRPYYETALTTAHTINPDRFEMARARLILETMGDKKVLTDGDHTIEVHLVKGTTHADDSVMAYLPKEKILIEGDLYDMPGLGVPAPTEGPATASNVVDNIERLKLSVERLLPVHAPDIVPVAELYKAARRTPPAN